MKFGFVVLGSKKGDDVEHRDKAPEEALIMRSIRHSVTNYAMARSQTESRLKIITQMMTA